MPLNLTKKQFEFLLNSIVNENRTLDKDNETVHVGMAISENGFHGLKNQTTNSKVSYFC